MRMRRMLAGLVVAVLAAAVAAQGRASADDPLLGVTVLQKHGPPENRIDVVVMGDGYKREQQNQFDDVAKSVPKTFAHDVTLGEYLTYFNFTRANVVSKEDGVDEFGREYDTALGARMLGDVKGHGHTIVDTGAVHRILGRVGGHDGFAVVFVRRGTLGTARDGIATIGGRDDVTVPHEWGHAFADLADEYVDMVHRGRGERSANVSDTDDPKRVPWAHWIAARTPMIGVYEGAAGMQRGAWKPTPGGCLMDRGEQFCRVCREQVVLSIYRFVDPIDEALPDPRQLIAGPPANLRFEVKVLKPKRHSLEVRWWLFKAEDAPAGPKGPRRAGPGNTREQRGKLPEIARPPRGRGTSFLVNRSDVKPGNWMVVCRVTDTTRHIDDEVWPWVLKDDLGLLESERRWALEVK